VPPT